MATWHRLRNTRVRSQERRLPRNFSVEPLEPRQLLALTVLNLPATDVTFEMATIGVEIVEADSSPTVSIYWGDEDGGTDVRLWDRVANLGNRPVGQHTTVVDGLSAGTEYFFRAFALTLSDGARWTDSSLHFTTASVPTATVDLEPVSVIGDTSAIVNGSIDGRGTLDSATLYYGTVNGGNEAAAWQHSMQLVASEGDFSARISNLVPGATYFVRLRATNAGGISWSAAQQLSTVSVPPVRISEVMSANASTLPTRHRLSIDDAFSGPMNSYDWFEIQNSTGDLFDLSGYYLSDSIDQPQRWQVPEGTTIPAQGSIVFFASGIDIKHPDLDELGIRHTNFSLSADGEPLLLVAPEGSIVEQLESNLVASYSDVSTGYFGTQFGTLQTPSPADSNFPVVPTIAPPVHGFANPDDTNSPLVVSVQVDGALLDVTEVRLVYRSMFEDELTVVMTDDGTGQDAVGGDGRYTAEIPGQTAGPGEMIRYAVIVTDAQGIPARMPRFVTEDNSPEYFGTIVEDPTIDTAVPVLHRFIASPSRAETGTGTRASVYFKGEFYDNVFIRIRGGTARSWPKKGYKIEFNDDYNFRFDESLPRVDEFNLNTTYTDKSYVRAILAYELYRDSGGIAPITFPMRVQQNGEFWNLSHFVEQPDRDFLRRNNLDPDGAMYKSMADRLNGLTARADGFFEKKTRNEEDYSDLQALIDGLALDGEELETFLFDNVDLPAQVNLMAVNVILQNLDATDKNYYIYRDTEGNQEWKMLPWDLDLVLGPNALNTDSFSTSDDLPPAHTSHPYMGTLAYPFYGRKNHLFDAIVNSPRTNQMFLRRVRSLMDEFMASAETPLEQRYFENRIDELVELLGPDVLLDKEKWGASASFPGRQYTLEEAATRIKDEYLVPRRVHLFETHNISRLDFGDIKVLIPESAENVEYFVPMDNSLGSTWTNRATPGNAEQWQVGQMGLGFEDSPADYADLINTRVKPSESCETCTSVFARVPFTVPDPSAIEHLTLRMKYDDGFVAYVNGVEVTRANTRSEVNGFDSLGRSHPDRDAVEFVNFDLTSLLPQMNLESENILAIHLMNAATTSNDLLLSLELVDGFIPNTTAVGIPNEQGPNAAAIAFADFDNNPSSGNQDEEYLELKNTTDRAFDISGWQLQGGLTHTFRGGTVIPAGESLFVTPSSLAFRNRATGLHREDGLFVQDGIQGHLSNRGETVQLVDRHGAVITSLTTPNVASDVQNYLRVTEIQYNPADATESLEFLELQNISTTTTLALDGVRITDGPSTPFDFSGSNVTTLAPGAYVLVVSDLEAFASAYPMVDAAIIAGTFEGALSNGGETIKVEDRMNSTVLEFRYEDGDGIGEESWHATTDGDGYSLVIRDANGSLANWGQGSGWRPSLQRGGSPGAADMPTVQLDLDGDGDVDADEIDWVFAGIRRGDLAYDLNADGVTDEADRAFLLTVSLNTTVGDSNLDGVFDSSDLVMIFVAGQFEDDVPGNSGWAAGDWDGDGDFTTSDLVAAFQAGSYVPAARPASPPLVDAIFGRFDEFGEARRKRVR